MFIPYRLRFTGKSYDTNANAWIEAVEVADGQPLEKTLKMAMNNLVLCLKSGGIWNSIDTMIIPMGARTIAGAMVDVKNPSTSWTQVSMNSSNYSRTMGLKGDGSNDYINSNYNNNTNGQNDFAMWCYTTEEATGTYDYIMGCGYGASGATEMRRDTDNQTRFLCRSGSGDTQGSYTIGLIGMTRSSSGSYSTRVNSTNETQTQTSQSPVSGDILAYATNNTPGTNPIYNSNQRACAFAIGSAHSLSVAESCMEEFIAEARAVIDFEAWAAQVEILDGQSLEQGVRDAMKNLVYNLHINNIWDSIGTMVVKMGARTVAGALVNIKSPAISWVNNGFILSDYNRTTGLKGNASKTLSSGRNNNADPQNDQSIWTYVTEVATVDDMGYMGVGSTSENGSTFIKRNNATDTWTTSRRSGSIGDSNANAVGLIGLTRNSSGSWVSRGGGANSTKSYNSQTPYSQTIYEYAIRAPSALASGSSTFRSDHRSCAAAIGASCDLAVVESIMETFISEITALSL